MIGYLYIRAYTFEDTGVGWVPGLGIYLHGLYRLLGVMSSAERNTAVCTNARIIMHVCKGRDH